jgi:hypothetical protein
MMTEGTQKQEERAIEARRETAVAAATKMG